MMPAMIITQIYGQIITVIVCELAIFAIVVDAIHKILDKLQD